MLALELGVVGLMNVQFAVKGGDVYILEVNPRASRTVPFVSKATGRPLAKIAAKVMAGRTLDELGVSDIEVPRHVAVKQSVFPFNKFPGVDTILGPEMRSTGEVMGISDTFARAFYKSMLAAGLDVRPPSDQGERRERVNGGPAESASGAQKRRAVFISVRDVDKPVACIIARRLRAAGYEILATKGTAAALQRARIPAASINKVLEGSPHVVEAIRGGTVAMVVNTTMGAREVKDSYSLRRQTLLMNIPYFTTIAAALAACDALESARGDGGVRVRSLQEWGE
jgi:carbamoyl-phosphate synthase large subunit